MEIGPPIESDPLSLTRRLGTLLPLSRSQLFALCLLTFALKGATVFYLSSLTGSAAPDVMEGALATRGGDTFAYLGATENYIRTGEYYFWNGVEKVRAGRMPHYGGVYYLFRLFSDQRTAYDLLVVAQIGMEAVSIILLSLLSYSLLPAAASFWLTYGLSLLSLNSTIWSFYLLPESFAISLLVFFLFFYSRYRALGSRCPLLLAGLCLACLVTLRPHFVLLYIPLGIEMLWKMATRRDWGTRSTLPLGLVALALPLAVLLAPWIARNFSLYGRFIPLQVNVTAGYHHTEADFAYWRFVQAWGGSVVFWDKRSAACYFQPKKNLPCEFALPRYALADGYTRVDVEEVRRDYILLQESFSEPLMKVVVGKFDRLTQIYRSRNPFAYYVVSPVLLSRALIFHSGSYYLPIRRDFASYRPYQLAIKISQSFLYYFTLVIGTLGLIWLAIKNRIGAIYLCVPFFLMVLFCFIIRIPEFRYFAPTYPVFILGTTYALVALWTRRTRAADGRVNLGRAS